MKQRPFSSFFEKGQYQKFRKNDIYVRAKWIKRMPGEKDFLTIATMDEVKELEKYLSQTHDEYNAEDYNMFTMGRDSRGNAMIGLQHCDQRMDMRNVAVIVFANDGLAEAVIESVNLYCLESDETGMVEKFNAKEERNAMGSETVQAIERLRRSR